MWLSPARISTIGLLLARLRALEVPRKSREPLASTTRRETPEASRIQPSRPPAARSAPQRSPENARNAQTSTAQARLRPGPATPRPARGSQEGETVFCEERLRQAPRYPAGKGTPTKGWAGGKQPSGKAAVRSPLRSFSEASR